MSFHKMSDLVGCFEVIHVLQIIWKEKFKKTLNLFLPASLKSEIANKRKDNLLIPQRHL